MNDNPKSIRFKIIKEGHEKIKSKVLDVSPAKWLSVLITEATK